MRIDLHCPVEHRSTELTQDDRGNVRAYIRLCNLSRHTVERLEAVAIFVDAPGGEAQAPFSMDDLSVKPRAVFQTLVSTGELPGATGVTVQFTRIVFAEDIPVWMYSPARMVELPDLPKPDGRDLNRLTSVAGSDAVVFPFQTSQLWLCVCSHANAYRRKRCRRCERERDHVLREYDMARLLSGPAPVTRPVDVDTPLMREPEKPTRASGEARLHRQFLRTRAMLIRRTVTMLVLIALIVLGTFIYRALTTKPDSIAPTKIEQSLTQSPSRA